MPETFQESVRRYKRLRYTSVEQARAAAEAFREMWGVWPWEKQPAQLEDTMNPLKPFKVWDCHGVLVGQFNALSKQSAKEIAAKRLGLVGEAIDDFVSSCSIEDVEHERACFAAICRDSYGYREY